MEPHPRPPPPPPTMRPQVLRHRALGLRRLHGLHLGLHHRGPQPLRLCQAAPRTEVRERWKSLQGSTHPLVPTPFRDCRIKPRTKKRRKPQNGRTDGSTKWGRSFETPNGVQCPVGLACVALVFVFFHFGFCCFCDCLLRGLEGKDA